MKTKLLTAIMVTILTLSIISMFPILPVSAGTLPIEYTFTGTTGTQTVNIAVVDDGVTLTWTVDFPGEAPYDEPTTEGNGHWAVAIIIALDGEGNGPTYQIHNNDGSTTEFPVGTWLMSPWGPTIADGWNGWHSGDTNTLVTDLAWVECSGEKYNELNPDGIFTITIDKSELGDGFHWALNLAIGSGFWSEYMTYEQMSYPDGDSSSFNWATPLVDMTVPNYELAEYAKISLTPEEGFVTTITGDAFTPYTVMTIMWESVKVDTVPTVVTTGTDGEFTAIFTAQNLNPASYTVGATDGVLTVYATFTVPDMTGPMGPQGPAGVTGATGATGAVGATGATGTTGVTGATGADGADGAIGATGVQGLAGIDGKVGIDGTDGIDGVNGTDGVDGLVGLSGQDGIDGIDGTDGTTGPQGEQGTTGPQGETGVSAPMEYVWVALVVAIVAMLIALASYTKKRE